MDNEREECILNTVYIKAIFGRHYFRSILLSFSHRIECLFFSFPVFRSMASPLSLRFLLPLGHPGWQNLLAPFDILKPQAFSTENSLQAGQRAGIYLMHDAKPNLYIEEKGSFFL